MQASEHPESLTRRLFLISPVSLSVIGMITFLVTFVFPPGLFESITKERNYVFLDLQTFAFNAACIAMLWLGCYLGTLLRPDWLKREKPVELSPPMSLTASIVLLLCLIAAGGISLLITSMNVGIGSLVSSVFSGGYRSAVKEQLESDSMGLGSLTPLMLPCYALALALACSITHSRLRWMVLLFLIALGAFFAPSALFARRSFLLRPIFALGLIMVVMFAHTGKKVTKYILFFFGGFAAIGVLVFALVAVIRSDATSTEKQVYDFTRYVCTSYNSEAMLLQGKMEWDGGGVGFYWTQFIWNFPGLANALDLHKIRQSYFGIAAPFGAETRSELLRDYGVSSSTNITAFGSSYIDFWYFGCIPFILMGFVFQHAFYSMLANRMYGMLMYPYVAWAAIDWRGNLSFPGATFGYWILIFCGCYALTIFFPNRDEVDDEEEIEDEEEMDESTDEELESDDYDEIADDEEDEED